MTNNICNDTAYINSLDQKKRMQLLNIPPVRFDSLAMSPYLTNKHPITGNQITKFDLDMRRKAEILQYNSNRMSTQTNSQTQKDKYSRIMAGNNSRKISVANISRCSLEEPIKRLPSSASGVPGNLLLYNDPNVNLYNYTNQTKSLGIIPQEIDTNIWNYTTPQNVYSVENVFSVITSIYIVATDQDTRTFKIRSPIVLSIGDTADVYGNYTDPSGIQLNISSVNINVKYSSSDVALSNNLSPVVRFTGFNYENSLNTIDISFNFITSSRPSYLAYCYLGLFEIDNLKLPTQSGYIYDIQIKVACNVKMISDTYNLKFNNRRPNISFVFDASMSNISYTTPTYIIRGVIPQPIPAIFPKVQVT